MTKQKKIKKFSVMFQKSISAEEIIREEKIEKNQQLKTHSGSLEKNIWLWSGVIVVMAVILFFWLQILPSQMQTKSADQASQNFFEKSKKDLTGIFNSSKDQVTEIKDAIAIAIGQAVSSTTPVAIVTLTSSTASSSVLISDEQIEKIKNKIIQKKK